MDTITSIYILISIIFGAAITYFLLKKKNALDKPKNSTQSLGNKELIGGYKQEIQESKMQILDLEKQLKDIKNNRTSDSLTDKELTIINSLKKKVKDSEDVFYLMQEELQFERTILKNKISECEKKFELLQITVNEREKEVADKDIKLSEKTVESEGLLYDIKSLQDVNNSLEDNKEKIETELQSRITLYENRIKTLNEEIENYKSEIAFEKSNMKAIMAKYEIVQVDILELKDINNTLKEDKEKIETELQSNKTLYEKRIKALNEEIEDYEDDIITEKKKTITKIAEIEELLDIIRNHEKRNQELELEKNKIEAELKDKTVENKLQADSLCFIQEILSAEDLKEEEIADHRPIDNVVEYVKELKNLLSIDHQMLERWSIIQKKQWIKNKTTIAFVGEFSAGKTSIVNRILSQDNPNIPLLPVNTKATTAIPTYISRGQSTQYRFVSPDHVLKSISEKTFKQVSKEVLDQVKGASNLLSHFVMSFKNDNLQELSILDTPGFNSNDKKDAERTIEVINECDALFWVMDVNSGTINKSSIDLIRKHLKKPLYIVINKIDTKAKSEVQKVEKLMRETFKSEGISVEEFIYFSAKADPKDIMNPIKSIKSSNGKDTFTQNISAQLKRLVEENEILLKTAKSQSDKGFTIVNKLTEQLVDALKELNKSCDDVSSIPQKKRRMFKERYEMTVDEADSFFNILENISEKQIINIVEIYNQQVESISTYQELLDVYYTRMDDLDNIKDCQSEFTNKISKLTQ